jgi:hypothetical protein
MKPPIWFGVSLLAIASCGLAEPVTTVLVTCTAPGPAGTYLSMTKTDFASSIRANTMSHPRYSRPESPQVTQLGSSDGHDGALAK